MPLGYCSYFSSSGYWSSWRPVGAAQILGASAPLVQCGVSAFLVSLLSLTGTSGMVNVFSPCRCWLSARRWSALTLRRCGWQLNIAAVPSVSPLLSHWLLSRLLFVSYNLFLHRYLAPAGKELRPAAFGGEYCLKRIILYFHRAGHIPHHGDASHRGRWRRLPMLAAFAGALGGAGTILRGAAALCHARYRASLRRCFLRHYCMVRFHYGEPPLQLCPSVGYPCMAVQPFRLWEASSRHCYPICGALGALALLGCCTIASPFARQSSCHRLFLGRLIAYFIGGCRPGGAPHRRATGFASVFRPSRKRPAAAPSFCASPVYFQRHPSIR